MTTPLPAPDPGDEQPRRAADGGHVPGACSTLGEFIRSLEDGQFDADAYEAVKDLAAAMHEHAWQNGGKAKGKLAIVIDFSQEGAFSEIKATFKVTKPEGKRPKSVMWMTEDGRFTRSNPKQNELFGFRDVSGGGAGGFRDA